MSKRQTETNWPMVLTIAASAVLLAVVAGLLAHSCQAPGPVPATFTATFTPVPPTQTPVPPTPSPPTATQPPTSTPTSSATPTATPSPTAPPNSTTATIVAPPTQTPTPQPESVWVTWYDYQGRTTSCGDVFDRDELTAAAPAGLAMNCGQLITLCGQDMCVMVTINDVVPASSAARYGGQVLDVTSAVMDALGIPHGYSNGVAYGRAQVRMQGLP